MTFSQIQFSALAWVRNLFSMSALTALLNAFGALWLVVEIADFFFRDTTIPARLQALWWLFALSGVGTAFWRCRPRTSVAHRLVGRDVTVEIAVGNVFSFPGAMIVGSNTSFDTKVSRKLISKDSVQGAFTKKYYTDESQLDRELADTLSGIVPETLKGQREGKSERYPVGTVGTLDPCGRRAYFVAIADMNEHGAAVSSFDMLKISLAELWVYIGSRGLKEPLVMPVLGTGSSRLTQPRDDVVREIVRSFVAACSERVFTEHLTIVLSPRDVAKHRISLDELGSFLRYLCLYTDFSSNDSRAVGSPA